MKTSDYYYELPKELIAQTPTEKRSDSKLLCVRSNSFEDRVFSDLSNILCENDLLVINNTKVIPSRMKGVKESGGKTEILLERIIDHNHALVQIKSSRNLKVGSSLHLNNNIEICIASKDDDFYIVEFPESVEKTLLNFASVPLPPYIKREAKPADEKRYQTVYASKLGAVAAPTAGLHFTGELLNEINQMNVDIGEITLHIGAGTFMPLRSEQLKIKKLHKEYFSIDQTLCNQIQNARKQGGRVIAVGTTATRALETLGLTNIAPTNGYTDIFIYPGFRFKVVDAMITNFHLPESSLMMLVAAFSGRDEILSAYRHAVENRYRFFSYGDAMFLERKDV